MRDLHSNLKLIAPSINIAAKTNGTSNGTGVDMASYEGVEFVFAVGVVTDGTHTPKIQESDDNSVFTDVAAADQIGTLAVLASNVHQTCGYIGTKRYVRPVITTASATTGAIAGAGVIRGIGRHNPLQ